MILIAHELKLDSYNCQHISGSPQLDRNRRKRTLRNVNKKFIDWFFTSITKEFQPDGIIAREGSSQEQNHCLGHFLFFQSNTSSEGANIIKLFGFYPRMAQDVQRGFSGGSKRQQFGSNDYKVSTYNSCWNPIAKLRRRIFLSFKFLSVATITSTEAVAQNERGYVLLSSDRIKCQLISAATEGTRKINKLGYVEVKKLPNLSEVGFPVTQTQRTKIFIKDISERGECWIFSSISCLRCQVVPGM